MRIIKFEKLYLLNYNKLYLQKNQFRKMEYIFQVSYIFNILYDVSYFSNE
jgi:hypothetical protein